ncbi:MAG: glycerol kinase GlpK [Alphaproteobacteria bacterium]|nr:glycerol kinase GlpK [Alphaproteobacteria bacterium]
MSKNTSDNLLAIDQGTTSTRAIIFSPAGDILATAQKELKLSYPQKGWVEQNPDDIWQDILLCCRQVLSQYPSALSIGITNQRETTVIWDRLNGQAIYPAIVWQDRRTADFCDQLKTSGHETDITRKTGLLLDPYFSATKIHWILNHVPGARSRALAGELAFGTIDSFLLWHLTGGRTHATDATNASRTMLFNIQTQSWDQDLLDLFDIPSSLLPEVKNNIDDFGRTDANLLGQEITIGGMAGDQQAALIGQACFSPGMIKSTYGTGCFALMNIGQNFTISSHRLLTTLAYRFDGEVTYALEGSIFTAGAAIQWLRDNLKIISHAGDTDTIARSILDNNGVYFVPAFTGLGAPYWNPLARAGIVGLTRESQSAHIIRAALEAQAYQTHDLMSAFTADTGYTPSILRVDGGLVANEFMCQFLSDMLDCPVDIPRVTETTALGAAYLAGLSAGLYTGLDDISRQWISQRQYRPQMIPEQRAVLYNGWQSAVRRINSAD